MGSSAKLAGSPESTGEQLWLYTARRMWGSEQEAEDFPIAQPAEDVCIQAVSLKPEDLHLKKATLMQKHLVGVFSVLSLCKKSLEHQLLYS